MFFKKKKKDIDDYIISLINFPIMIEAHKHPLLFCTTERSGGWKCNKCSSGFNSDEPSFYCTYCDYDLCPNCLGNCKLNQIKKYVGNLNNFSNIENDKKTSFDWQVKYPNHNHLLTSIKRKNNSSYTCNDCKKENNNQISSYYCSLCDYDICAICFLNNKVSCCSSSDETDDDYYPRKKSPQRYSCKKKPVIYLYPEKEMDISVQLEVNLSNNKLSTIYPKFNQDNNTWNGHVKPNGDIQIKDKIYPYLFWEAQSYFIEEMNEGFIVKDENAEEFLEEKLKILGLNDKESTDFITFWLPVLLKNKLSLCSFQSQKFCNDIKLNVTPKPDTMIRIFLCIKKIDSPIDIKEQKLEKNERKGFTVIEWGGSDF